MSLNAYRCLIGGLLVLAAALAGCQPETPPMTPAEAQQVEALTARLTPRCVGRYLIDLPEKFVLNSQSSTILEDVTISIEPMPRWRFDDHLAVHKEVLERTKLPLSGHAMLRSATPIEGGLLFDHAKSDASSGRAARLLDAQFWRNGFKISAAIEAFDGTFPEDAQSKYHREFGTDVPKRTSQLMDIASRLQGRRDDEIPQGQGVCFANGFLKGPPTDREWLNMYHHWSGVEDVYFTYRYISSIGPQTTTLPERGPAIEAELKSRNGATLRKGPRSDADLPFDEWVVERDSSSGARTYRFTLEANSQEGTALKPLFIMNLSSGVRHPRPAPTLEEAAVRKPIAQASLSAAPSVALWDKVTQTLRPRPGAF